MCQVKLNKIRPRHCKFFGLRGSSIVQKLVQYVTMAFAPVKA